MVEPLTPPANSFVRRVRKIYNPIGFQRGYNFVLWFIFAGAMLGFVLARFQYLNINGVFCKPGSANGAAPGECYYYMNFDRYKIGIRLHLYTILPAGFLVVFQFTPFIRHKLTLVHRITGYLVIILALIANAGALMIAKESFGGTVTTQTMIGFLAIITTVGLALAYYNIKRLQIDQHRAWMLRTWFYFSTIITLRLINMAMVRVITDSGADYVFAQPCAKLASIFGDAATLESLYPACADLAAKTLVHANGKGNPAEIATINNICFGVAGWLAIAIHAIGIEVYLHLTPRESQRLREVSYQRQMEAGMSHAGNSGLTVQRLGDANEWTPLSTKRHESEVTVSGSEQVDTVKNEP